MLVNTTDGILFSLRDCSIVVMLLDTLACFSTTEWNPPFLVVDPILDLWMDVDCSRHNMSLAVFAVKYWLPFTSSHAHAHKEEKRPGSAFPLKLCQEAF